MQTNVIVIDDFYSNPDGVRSFALQQEFAKRENFPGLRTRSFLNDSTKATLSQILYNAAGEITNWNDRDGLTGSFELATSRDRSWIHTDHFNTWAGLIYLTPDAPLSGGTGFYRYRETGAIRASELEQYESQDMTKWELYDVVGNRYNRLVLYHSDLFHNSIEYFGQSKEDGRLFQLFFLTTEY
jgi:hypothetical protein